MTKIPGLPDILVQDLERKWEEFKQSSATNKVNLPKDRQILKALQRVFAFSDFVAQNCIRNPLLLSDLISSGDLQRRYFKNAYDQRLKKALEKISFEPIFSMSWSVSCFYYGSGWPIKKCWAGTVSMPLPGYRKRGWKGMHYR